MLRAEREARRRLAGRWVEQLPVLNCGGIVYRLRENTVSDQKQDEGFKVIDRRPFTAEGEVRKEVVEEQEREAKREEVKEQAAAKEAQKKAAAAPAADAPKKSPAFENLVRMLGSNAAMVLGAYPDPNTGQPMVDPDAAR